MSEQPEALRLADVLEDIFIPVIVDRQQAAAELRRLHEVNQELLEALKLALRTLEYIHEGANNQGPHTGISWRCASNKAEPAITAIREALADHTEQPLEMVAEQPAQQQEPSMAYKVKMCPRQECASASKCTSFSACSTRAYIKPEQPAQQQEPVAWMKDCADFWEHYTYISEASQENYKAEAQMWVEKLRTSPQPSKPLTGVLSIAYSGGRVVTCSFKTEAEAKAFEQYAIEAAHKGDA